MYDVYSTKVTAINIIENLHLLYFVVWHLEMPPRTVEPADGMRTRLSV